MSLFDKFRKKSTSAPGQPAPVPTPIPAPPLPDAMPVTVPSPAAEATEAAAVAAPEAPQEPSLRVYDEFGREVFIPLSQWRAEVLPHALAQVKDNPDGLSAILLDAVQAGAAADIVPQAAHLQAIDPNQERGAAIYGLVLLAANQPVEAEDVLVTYLGQAGPSATVLTHLARAQAVQNRMDEADATLWRALEADPNDEGAVSLYASRSREREGDFGWQSALERAATLPGAWLPLVWLGRSALDARNRTLAVGLYKNAIELAGRPSPTLLLQAISGDLGQFGLLDDLIRLVRPAYEPGLHGLTVGNNLMRALLDSGEPQEALTILRDLAALNQPELAGALRAWEVEIRRRDLMAQAQSNPPQPQMLRIDGPVWLPAGTPSRQLYPTENPRRGTVLFLGSSMTLPEGLPQEVGAPLADTAGRLSRALPLYLAESAFALLALDTQTMVPWAEIAGFAMLNQPWPEEAAAAYARDANARAAVTAHIEATPEGGTVTLRVIPAASTSPVALETADEVTPIDFGTAPSELSIGSPAEMPGSMSAEAAEELASADRPGVPSLDAPALPVDAASDTASDAPEVLPTFEPATISVSFTWPELFNAVPSLWPQLAIPLVTAFGDTEEHLRSGRYTPPRGMDLNIYLRLLEQLLAINCAMTSRHAPLLITGEAETLRTTLDLALRVPNSLPVRLILGELLLRLRALHPELVLESAQPIAALNERFPFPDSEAAQMLQAQTGAAMQFGAPQAVAGQEQA